MKTPGECILTFPAQGRTFKKKERKRKKEEKEKRKKKEKREDKLKKGRKGKKTMLKEEETY